MKDQQGTAIYTAEFRREFDADTAELLPAHLRWFAAIWGSVHVIVFLVHWLGRGVEALLSRDIPIIGGNPDWSPATCWSVVLGEALIIALYATAYVFARGAELPRTTLSNLSGGLVVAEGLIRLTIWTQAPDTNPLLWMTLTHVAASAMLPWTVRHALRPALVFIGLAVFTMLIAAPRPLKSDLWIAIAFSPFVGVPGTVIAWLKHTRRVEQFKLSAITRRYSEFRRELTDAKRIHEAMFPPTLTDGPIRFWYEYEPMRSIGGDFVFARKHPTKNTLSVALVDVTGHGIAAALTVNRLFGELERVFAENEDIGPGAVLGLLNRYVHLTLAKHSVYATAICMRVDCDTDEVLYASAGHPPGFIRGVDNTVHELESTAFVLGVCSHEDFDPGEGRAKFMKGDALVAYTDGAMEARNPEGRMLGLRGMRSVVAATPAHVAMMARRSFAARPMEESCGAWARMILDAVESHRDSAPPEDDTLIVEVSRPIGRPTLA